MEDLDNKLVIGIDGFVDQVWQVVKTRNTLEDYQLYEEMSDFSRKLAASGNGGFLNEILYKRRDFGGFTGNAGSAVIGLGIKPTIIGLFGKDRIDPVYERFIEESELITTGNPAIDQIFEFADGKLMMPTMIDVISQNWQNIVDAVGMNKLKEIFSKAEVIALGYWSIIFGFNEIVEGIYDLIGEDGKNKRLLFDLSDIRKSDKTELMGDLEKLSALNEKMPMTLCLNEHETEILFSHCGETLSHESKEAEDADEKTERVRKIIGMDELVVHTPYFAVASSSAEGRMTLPQNHCDLAVATTGAGDHFNGAYAVGLLRRLPMAERLALANAVVYWYVSMGWSPSEEDVQSVLSRA